MLAGWILLVGVLVICLGVNASFHSMLLQISPTDAGAWTVWLMLGIISVQPLTIAAGAIHLKLNLLSRVAFALALTVLCLSALVLGSMAAASTANLSAPLHVSGIYGVLAVWFWLLVTSLVSVKLRSLLPVKLLSVGILRRGSSNVSEGPSVPDERCLLNWRNHQISIGGLLLFTGVLAISLMLTLAAIPEGRAPRHMLIILACVILCKALLVFLLRPLCYAVAEESNWFRFLLIPLIWFFAILILVNGVQLIISASFTPSDLNAPPIDISGASQVSELLLFGAKVLGSPGRLGATMLFAGACLIPTAATLALRLLARK